MSDQLISQALHFRLDNDPAVPIRQRVNEILDDIRVGGADVLVAVWEPEKDTKTFGGIILPDKVRSEYQYQGTTGLILKMGPLCYISEKTRHWFVDVDGEPDPPRIGEWVSFTFNQGSAFLMRQQPCRLVNDQHILLRISRPDLIA